MKILHLLAYANRGGCEKNCFHFIESTLRFDHQVLVLDGPGPMVDEWRSLGVKVGVMEVLHFNFWSFWHKVNSTIPRARFDKVIVWTTIRMPLLLNALNVVSNCEIYVHVGNPVQLNTAYRWKNWLFSRLFPVRNEVNLRPVSTFVKQSLATDPYYNRFSNRVSLKPIRETEIRAKRPDSLEKNSAIKLGMVARLDTIKDHRTVIRGFAGVASIYCSAILELVGDGPLFQELKDLSNELGIGQKVRFLGEVKEVQPVMKDWDLFLYATTLREGLGGTIPEALSIGLPVVAGDLPMIREWDHQGNFIYYCRPFDATDMAEKTLTLLSNLHKRQFVHANAPRYISQNFSPQAFAKNYIAE